eukprot:Partr_v1_DN26726_c1_g1_i1_m8332 putative Ribosomal protein S5
MLKSIYHRLSTTASSQRRPSNININTNRGDAKNPSFSPALGSILSGGGGKSRYRSPYASIFPSDRASSSIPQEVPMERPFERLIKLRRLIRKNAKGKIMRYDAWVLAGNRNGSAGLAHSQSSQAYKAVQGASRRARKNMKYFELFENRTLYHDIICKYQTMKLRLMPKPAGYSIRAQRNVEDVCWAVGIKDLAGQVMGGKVNPITVVRAMFQALELQHKTPTAVARARGRRVSDIRSL